MERKEEGREEGLVKSDDELDGGIDIMNLMVGSQGLIGPFPTLANGHCASCVFLPHVRPGCGLQETLNHITFLPAFLPDHTIASQRCSTGLWIEPRMLLEREEVRAWLEGIHHICGFDQVSWNGRFLSPARHRQDSGARRGKGP